MKGRAIRERTFPKIWDVAYLLTRGNREMFNELMKLIIKEHDRGEKIKILDLECGYKPFKYLFEKAKISQEYIGIDFSREK